jgi:hypothetical protein
LLSAALVFVCARETLDEKWIADEIKTAIEKRLRNCLLNMEAFIRTCSQGGKVIPRRCIHSEKDLRLAREGIAFCVGADNCTNEQRG